MDNSRNEARAAFIETTARILDREGLAPITGKIVGLLIFENRPMSFSEIAIFLGVSRGSVTENTRRLTERGVIRKFSRPRDRQDWFEMATDDFDALLEGTRARMQQAARDVRAVMEMLPPEADERERLSRFADMHDAIAAGVSHALRRS